MLQRDMHVPFPPPDRTGPYPGGLHLDTPRTHSLAARPHLGVEL